MGTIEYLLTLLDWQFFINLSWSNSRLGSGRSRANNVDEFLRSWVNREGVAWADTPAFLRWERGETRGRPHFHGFLSGLPEGGHNLGVCFRQKAIWKRHFGLSIIRLFDPLQRAEVCSYVSGSSKLVRQNTYEIRKSEFADMCVFNDAAWRELQRRCGVEPFNVAPAT